MKILKLIPCLFLIASCNREVGVGESLGSKNSPKLFKIADIGEVEKVCELSNGTKIFRFEVGHVGASIHSHWVYFSDKNEEITINKTITQGKSSANETIVQIPVE